MCPRNVRKSAEHGPYATKVNESLRTSVVQNTNEKPTMLHCIGGVCLANGCILYSRSYLHRDWYLPYFGADNIPEIMRVSVVPHCLVSQRFGIKLAYVSYRGRDSVVGIATRYGPDGPGNESRWGGWGSEIFRTRPDRPWGPSSLLYNGYQVCPGGKAAGAWRWPPTPI
jgi:hypothetical protein